MNNDHVVTKKELAPRPSDRKGKTSKRIHFVRNVIREVAGFAPYEKRITELLKFGKDKRALKVAKRKLSTYKRAKKKREEMSNVLPSARKFDSKEISGGSTVLKLTFQLRLQFIEMRNQLKDLLKTPLGEWYEGKITRHDHFDDIRDIDDALNRVPEDLAIKERRRYTESCFGHFFHMHREMKLSADIVHRLLMRELHYDGLEDEMRFMLGHHLVWFSKIKFCLIIGLKFGVIPDTTEIFAFKVIPELMTQIRTCREIDLSPRILKWESSKRPRSDKLAQIFTSRMFARTALVPTAAERAERLVTEGSEPEFGGGSPLRHKQVGFAMPGYTSGVQSRGVVGGDRKDHLKCKIQDVIYVVAALWDDLWKSDEERDKQ
ncbi:hypothetical protein Dsin_030108 [Dipteronia sinensis]|uniref:60S ribosomal protein L36 n=1 Tax=Dipteronia sinensis TaxID=43782 RepID=A0AAE0DQY1_9ROSI|nr:hypothetical protein Dsin_030108 [Dipteronia sinensis]